MGKGTAYGGLAFLGIGCPVLNVANIYLYVMFNVWATVSTIVHLLRMIPPMDFLFEKQMD